jgi:hypothetical protein
MSEFGGFFHAHFVADYAQVRSKLTKDLLRRGTTSCLTTIVFANGRREFVKKTLLPLVPYWNYRSKDWVTFFFVGYVGDETLRDDDPEPWPDENSFHEPSFVEAIEDFERECTWTYDGRTSVMVCAASLRTDPTTGETEAALDFGSMIDFDLEKAMQDGVIDAPEVFFEAMIRFAKENSGANLLTKISDGMGAKSFAKAIVDGVLEYLPKAAKKGLSAVNCFRVKDKAT